MTRQQIKCEQALKHLFDYIDQEIADGDRAAMEQHLHTCKSCFSRFEFERRIKARLGQLGGGEVDSQIHDRIRKLFRNF
jgi:anti-sigma factor (TIGR02949 family)